MKKLFIILVMFIMFAPCAFSKESKVFIYHIPDNVEKVEKKPTSDKQLKDIVSDDITADTSFDDKEDNDEIFENDIPNFDQDYEDEVNYNLSDMYTDVLQGYTEYNESDSRIIFPDIKSSEYFAGSKLKNKSLFGNQQQYTIPEINSHLSKFNSAEYSIHEVSGGVSKKCGAFSTGTTYNQGISYGELEQTSGVFSKYELKNFAISTSFKKTVNTTNNNYNDNFYITPEFKINDYFSLKENLSTDFIKKKNKAELVFSINPFGKRDYDRLKLDFGASRTYNQVDNSFKSQIQFSTKFKF